MSDLPSSLDDCKHQLKPLKKQAVVHALALAWPKAAYAYDICGTRPIVVSCLKCGTYLVSRVSCNLRICPRCMLRKAAQYRQRVLTRLAALGRLRFITLTLPAHVRLTRKSVDLLRRAFNAWKHDPQIRHRLAQHAYFIEATPKPDGWHLHLHILAAGAYIPQKLLSRTWEKYSGAPIVHVTAVTDTHAALNEVLKYALKAGRIADPERQAEFALALKGVRLFQCCGGLHPLPRQDGHLPCPSCGGQTWVKVWPWDLEAEIGEGHWTCLPYPNSPTLVTVMPP